MHLSSENHFDSKDLVEVNLSDSQRTARVNIRNDYRQKRLLFAIGFCLVLFAAELAGGMYAGSLALVSDAFHMLSDTLGYLLSFTAIYYSSKPRDQVFAYGYKRIEVLGALGSVLLIWVLTLGLVIEAYDRMYHPTRINGQLMLYMAGAGVVVNCALIFIFGHEESGSSHEMLLGDAESRMKDVQVPQSPTESDSKKRDINIRAAMLHAIGDLLCSVGVLIAAVVIVYRPDLQWVDPLCTFVFGMVAIYTTLDILRDIFMVLMQANTSDLPQDEVEKEIRAIYGVESVCEMAVWALTMDELVAHIVVKVHPTIDLYQVAQISDRIKDLLSRRRINQTTVETVI